MRASALAHRAGLDPPSLTPTDAAPGQGTPQHPGSGTQYGDPELFATAPDGSRSLQLPLAPGAFQEQRVMIADRAAPDANFTPGANNANADPQRGGSPGGGPDTNYTTQNEITSQGPDGVTRVNGVPPSPRKLAYGWSDYSGHMPTFVGAHLKIQWNANPNKPQLNPTPFNNEGPQMNTQYSTPAPFAAGTFIG